MQERGFELKTTTDKRCQPYFDVLGEKFQLSIRESSKRFERKRDESQRRHWSFERYDYAPTGVLQLCINYGAYSADATLRDTIKTPLEERLNAAIIAMLRTVDRRRQQAESARQKAIEKAARKKIAVEQEVKRRSDRVRVERLHQVTQQWESHQRLTAFVDAVRREAQLRSPNVDADTLDWLTWADAYLREIDPLSGGEELPTYSLTDAELEQLRRECATDWNEWSETFRQPSAESSRFNPGKPR